MSREVGLRGRLGVEGGLQAQGFGAVGCGRFVRRVQLRGEGLDLALAGGELCGLHGELLSCGVRERVVFVFEIGVVFLEGVQCRAEGADVLFCFYLAAGLP